MSKLSDALHSQLQAIRSQEPDGTAPAMPRPDKAEQPAAGSAAAEPAVKPDIPEPPAAGPDPGAQTVLNPAVSGGETVLNPAVSGETVLNPAVSGGEADLFLCTADNQIFTAKRYRRQTAVKPDVLRALTGITARMSPAFISSPSTAACRSRSWHTMSTEALRANAFPCTS